MFKTKLLLILLLALSLVSCTKEEKQPKDEIEANIEISDKAKLDISKLEKILENTNKIYSATFEKVLKEQEKIDLMMLKEELLQDSLNDILSKLGDIRYELDSIAYKSSNKLYDNQEEIARDELYISNELLDRINELTN